MTQIDPYNPLDLEALGQSLLRELERRPALNWSEVAKFVGSGIYALYFVGRSGPYAEIGRINRTHGCRLPIYVGRSKDTGARQGLNPFEPVTRTVLYSRVREHVRSIEKAANLESNDFRVRVLVVMPIWIPLAEAMAIRQYRPLWNSQLQGFGIHAPGSGRSGQARSQWDLVHPGRSFASGLRASVAKSQVELLERLRDAALDAAHRFSALERGIAESIPQQPEPTSPAPRSRSASSPRPKRR
jgi:hypothetical protein